MRITAEDIGNWASGEVNGAARNTVADGISFDTRGLRPGQAFVAVKGDRDGHDFCAEALNRGASVLVVGRGRSIADAPCVEVEDTIGALADVARGVRERLRIRNGTHVVGITGSAGKTSTKNMVHSILSAGFVSAHGAQGSYNNDLGLPTTMINAPEDCDAMVLELAMRGHGEIARLCRISHPTVAVLTVIGDAHSDRVGGVEGVARAKGEIVEGMESDGTVVANLDDPWTPTLLARRSTDSSVLSYGRNPRSDLVYRIVSRQPDGRVDAEFSHGLSTHRCLIPLPGDHMASNAAAAVAVGVCLGMDLVTCVEALSGASGEPGRMQWVNGRGGLRILDDSYNANTSSMMAALETIAAMPAARRVAVLGLVAEVSEPEQVHRDIARRARELGIELLALETDLYGVTPHAPDDVVDALAGSDAGTVLLVKGSRIADTGRVVRRLTP